MGPLVSVIIVNHNGIDFVDGCLRSVLNSNYPDFEVIFVDNASTDGSREYVKETFGSDRRLCFAENSESVGPARGRNIGVAQSMGLYLVFFDNDTVVTPQCLDELVRPFESDKSIGAAQAKLLQLENRSFYDCAGDYLGPLGFLIERSKRKKDIGQFDTITDIFSAKSAASIIRRDIFAKVGGFDNDFYMYLEETDLSWRVWLSGYRVVFIPRAVVYHAFGSAKKELKSKTYYPKYVVKYYGCRNYILTLIKNFSLKNLIKILPLHIFAWCIIAFFFLLKAKTEDCYYIAKAIGWNIFNLRSVIAKRKEVQKAIRAASDAFIMQRVLSKETIASYLKKLFIYTSI